jgi:hypothetical protein
MRKKRAIVLLAGLAIVTALQKSAIADVDIEFADCVKRIEQAIENKYRNWKDEGTGLTWTQTPIDRQFVIANAVSRTTPVKSHLTLINADVFAERTCTPTHLRPRYLQVTDAQFLPATGQDLPTELRRYGWNERTQDINTDILALASLDTKPSFKIIDKYLVRLQPVFLRMPNQPWYFRPS